MSDVTLAALIGAGAATLGGLVAGTMNIGLERLRIGSARRDARRAELREAMTDFFVKDREWRVAWESLERGEYEKQEDWIYPLAVASRGASYTLSLLAPDEVFVWWRDSYSPRRNEFEEIAAKFAEKGEGSEAERDAAARRAQEEIERGRELCRAALGKLSLP
ncbi:MAG: hypothetical protein ABR575_02855 [Actinomycetota bacterium]